MPTRSSKKVPSRICEVPIDEESEQMDFGSKKDKKDDAVYFGLHYQDRNKRRESLRDRRMSRIKSISVDTAQLHEIQRGGARALVDAPSQRVALLLSDEFGAKIHPVFSELLELTIRHGLCEWWETARWLKFEEDVEQGGERWCKPYVATLSLHSVMELRTCVQRGVVLLDLDASSQDKIAGIVSNQFVQEGWIQDKHSLAVKKTLCMRHRHLGEKRKDEKSKKKSKQQDDDEGESGDELDMEEGGGENKPLKGNTRFRKKMSKDVEAANLLIGEQDYLKHTMVAFVRLSEASYLGDLTEVNIPSRFVFILMGPKGNLERYREIGRTMGTLLADEVFREVAYRGKSREDLLAGVDEFLDAVIVLPPTEWDPQIKIEPPEKTAAQDQRRNPKAKQEVVDEEEENEKRRRETGLCRTGRIFGGLIDDVKRKAPYFKSDFTDGCSIQSVAAILFLYFATLSPIITFGGLLEMATGRNIAVIESLLSALISGVLYGLFSGQPLTILNTTGPVLVFETITYTFCQENDLDFLEFRLYIGIWIFVAMILLVAFECSYLVCYITRFTEENFALLIALVYIVQSVEKMISLAKDYPIKTHPELHEGQPDCWGGIINNITKEVDFNGTLYNITEEVTVGETCYVSDVYMFAVMEFLATFVIIVYLKNFKYTVFFSFPVRQKIGDFAVVFVIGGLSFIDYLVGVATPKLYVPDKLVPTLPTRGWLVPPFVHNPWWTFLVAIVPALLGTILIFMDQQITAVIINRKENQLKKGPGYHLDLFILAFLILVCSIIGVPWLVAGTVVAITHVNALKMESECAAPGEKPQFLGVRENRLTQVCIFALIGASVVLTPILNRIPMPVLFGVFMYMGTSPLAEMQFFQRLLLFVTPMKYQPNFPFLRHVRIGRVHLFTLIQLICMSLLWIVKLTKPISITFPFMLVVMMLVRWGLDWVFTQEELKYLDDILPIARNRNRHDNLRDAPLMKLLNANANPLDDMDMSKELSSTGLWRQANSSFKGPSEKRSLTVQDVIEESPPSERKSLNGIAETPT